MHEKQLKFGDWVWVEFKLFRRSETKIIPFGRGPNNAMIMKTIKYWHSAKQPRKKAVFLGFRTLKNGYVDYDEYGNIFNPLENIKAALVCEGPRKKPFYVLIEDIKTIEPF